jgi:hypothetical protein
VNAEELRLRRLELEARLTYLIAQELAGFREDTGLSIEQVRVGLVNVQTHGDRLPIYVVSDVRCEVAI